MRWCLLLSSALLNASMLQKTVCSLSVNSSDRVAGPSFKIRRLDCLLKSYYLVSQMGHLLRINCSVVIHTIDKW